MSIIYEVCLQLDVEVADAHRAWLLRHIEEILALPGFVEARLLEQLEPEPPAGRVGCCVQYRLQDRAALDTYLRTHAPRLRADGERHFGGRFTAVRRILLELPLNVVADAP